MPTSRPSALAFDLFLAQQLVAGGLARARQAVDKAGTVPDDAGGDPVRELVGSDQVPQTKLNGIDRKTLRRHVDQPLHDEGRDWPADAAIRAGRGLAGCDRPYLPAVGWHPVGTRQETRDLDGLERGSPRIDRIGADIADHLGGKRQNVAVPIQPEFGFNDFVEAMRRRDEILLSAAGPAHRSAEVTGE